MDKHWPSVFTMLLRRLLSPSHNGRVNVEILVPRTSFEGFYWINAQPPSYQSSDNNLLPTLKLCSMVASLPLDYGLPLTRGTKTIWDTKNCALRDRLDPSKYIVAYHSWRFEYRGNNS